MTYEELDDMALVATAPDDPDAFGELYERYMRKMYNYIYYRTGNVQDAEDLTAKVFQRAFRHVHRFEDKGVPFSAWLYRIAHNLVANWHRDHSKRTMVPLEHYHRDEGAGIHPEKEAIAGERTAELLSVLRELPEDRQQLLILKFVERLSNAEIGAIMGRTEGAVKSLYHRTLTSLRKQAEKGELGNLAAEESVSSLDTADGVEHD